MASTESGITCEQCDRDTGARTVTLVLDAGVVHKFCGDRCEQRWTREALIRMRRFARRIFTSCRGRGAELARTALYTDTPP